MDPAKNEVATDVAAEKVLVEPTVLASAQTIAVPKPEKLEEPKVSLVATINFNQRMSPPPFINTFPDSMIEYKQSKYDYSLRIRLNSGETIDASNPVVFDKSVLDMCVKWMKKYYLKIGNVKSEIEPSFGRAKITPYDAIGFNLKKAFLDIDHENVRRFDDVLATVADSDVPDKDKARAYTYKSIILHASELALLTRADEISVRRYRGPDLLHAFFARMADMQIIVNPLPTYDADFVKTYVPPKMVALDKFINSNFLMPTAMWEIWSHIVKTHIPISIIANDVTFQELLQVMSATNSVHRKVNDYPARLSSVKGLQFIQVWLTAKFASRYGKMFIPAPLEDVSLSYLMQCVCAKLMVAKHEIATDSLIDVDNYIARWLLPAFLTPTGKAKYVFDYERARDRSVNYLELNYRAGVLAMPSFWGFFLTTNTGGGWATAGQNQVIPVPVESVNYLNKRKFWYRPCSGRLLDRRDETPMQFQLLMQFVAAIPIEKQLIISSAHEHIGRSLVKLLAWLVSKRSEFSDVIWFYDRVISKYSYNALCFVDDMQPREHADNIIISPDAIFSALSYLSADARTQIDLPLGLIHAAWAIHDDFNELNDYYSLIKDRMNTDVSRNIYTRKDFFKWAVEKSTNGTGFLTYLQGKMIDNDELKSTNMPGSRYVTDDFTDRYANVAKFINQNLQAFGVSKHFRYAPLATYGSNLHFKRFLTSDSDPFRTISYQELQMLISTETYGPLMREARLNGRVIVFGFPINFTLASTDVWTTMKGPLVLPTATNVASFQPIKVEFTDRDIILNDNASDIADFGVYPWLIDELPFIGYDVSFFTAMIRNIVTPKRDWTFVADVTFSAAFN
jgi:hypothetical protein